ncbi:hypothetical protein MPF19_07235 [Polaribacter sp. Z014]|uniref:hypothetical protein n=1 Tax=unclassified Polaribacter TaxID=196858 RepID=UPI00193C377A|nr:MULTISPECIES: hypothetical protein [unclassified Polaribacter]MCL7763203.1 hypothetical protein [Polaribacter sp. Z014]QVY67142.1 hypothetical protein JOP69_07705 [Polaribacter sp. Q13]
MKKYKYLIASVLLIILMILIFIPRNPERIYFIYDKDLNACNQKIIWHGSIKDSYLICNHSKFIYFKKNQEKKSIITNLSKIDNYKILSKDELLKRFHNGINYRVKNDFDLLDRYKKFDFRLIIRDTILNKIEIIPVNNIRILS